MVQMFFVSSAMIAGAVIEKVLNFSRSQSPKNAHSLYCAEDFEGVCRGCQYCPDTSLLSPYICSKLSRNIFLY